MLAYHSIVSTLHSSLRDSLEISLGTMFLKGHVNRDRDDWMDLALRYDLIGLIACFCGLCPLIWIAFRCMRSTRVRSEW